MESKGWSERRRRFTATSRNLLQGCGNFVTNSGSRCDQIAIAFSWGPSNAYRCLYRGTAASPALAGCFHHQGLSNFIAGRLAPRLRVRHTHDELVRRLGSIFDLGFRWQPRSESRDGQHPGRHLSPLVSPPTSLKIEGVAGWLKDSCLVASNGGGYACKEAHHSH